MPMAPRPRPSPNAGVKRVDNRQFSAAERGYDWNWTKAKRARMHKMTIEDEIDPFCRYCRVARADVLDHAIPLMRQGAVGSMAYNRWLKDERYLIPCCGACNTRKGDLLPAELKVKHPEMYQRMVAVLTKRGVSPNGR